MSRTIKQCTDCLEWKVITDFYKEANSLDRHRRNCKACKSEKDRVHHAANSDLYRARAAAWREANKGRY